MHSLSFYLYRDKSVFIELMSEIKRRIKQILGLYNIGNDGELYFVYLTLYNLFLSENMKRKRQVEIRFFIHSGFTLQKTLWIFNPSLFGYLWITFQ